MLVATASPGALSQVTKSLFKNKLQIVATIEIIMGVKDIKEPELVKDHTLKRRDKFNSFFLKY